MFISVLCYKFCICFDVYIIPSFRPSPLFLCLHERRFYFVLSGRFTEDGSFIGQYVPGARVLPPPPAPQPPTYV